MTRRRLRMFALFATGALPLAFCASAAAVTLSYDTLGEHALAAKPDGSLWAWGSNTYGQLGKGDFFTREPADWSPARIGTENTWMRVATGGQHSLAIKTDGSLWVWGWNSDGELGLGDTTDRPVPTRLGSALWQKVDAGLGFSAGIQTDGSSWAWGYGGLGTTGSGTTVTQLTPYLVMPGKTFTDVRCGLLSLWATDATGQIWEWGCNSQELLGNGSTVNQLVPIASPFTTALWRQISLGYSTSAGVRTDGTLWTWGMGIGVTPQRFGTGTTWNDVVAGEGHDLALADGQLWAWGDNTFGQLGIGSHTSQTTPVQVGTGAGWASARAAGNVSMGGEGRRHLVGVGQQRSPGRLHKPPQVQPRRGRRRRRRHPAQVLGTDGCQCAPWHDGRAQVQGHGRALHDQPGDNLDHDQEGRRGGQDYPVRPSEAWCAAYLPVPVHAAQGQVPLRGHGDRCRR
jgi:alpha-tubulin suppressor-like RCC1 family protein